MERGDCHGGVGGLIDRVGRVTRALQFADGLSPAQWGALRYVARANRYSRNPTALADFLGATKGTVSQTLIALEEKGYLRRVRGSSDRRAVCLNLTAAGTSLLGQDPLTSVDDATSALSPVAHAALVEALSRVLRDLQRRHGGSEFGVCERCCLFVADGAADEPGGPNRCGLTGDAFDDDERRRICVDFCAHA